MIKPVLKLRGKVENFHFKNLRVTATATATFFSGTKVLIETD
jgi:hypothetical protein